MCARHYGPCPSPAPRVYPNSCPLSWGCHPTISFSVVPFSSCPQSLPASGSFPVSQLFTSGGQSRVDYNVVLVFAVHKSDSVIDIHTCVCIYILFQILFHCGRLQDIEYSSLYSTVGACCLSVVYIILCIC